MTITGPRLRSLLRQAEKVASVGKMAAAESLYRQVTEEAPESPEGWLGLAQVSSDLDERKAAFEQALALDPHNETAQAGLAAWPESITPTWEQVDEDEDEDDAEATAQLEQPLVGATIVAPPTPRVERTERTSTPTAVPTDPAGDLSNEAAAADVTFTMTCYRHPGRETSLRCYKCNRPICSECTIKTPVGYLCPVCNREAEDTFYNARPLDNLVALLIALPLGLIAGYLVFLFGRSFFFWIILFFIGGAVGSLIGRLTKRAIGKRRGRYVPYIVAGCVIAGALLFALPYLLVGSLGALIGPGVYLFVAVPAAFYWSR